MTSRAEVSTTFLTPDRFAEQPQVGLPITQDWPSFLRWLTWPSFADDKRAAGAWCPSALDRGIVKGGKGPVALLVGDVDDCIEGALERSADALGLYAGAVVPTFNATPAKPKHRIVLLLARPLSAEKFPIAWTKMQTDLACVGVHLDRGCKNINRLYFACVARSPEAWRGARLLTGEPVNVDSMLEAARAEKAEADAELARRPKPKPVLEKHRDKYIDAALMKARGNVFAASEGGRHDALLREAYSLARLDLSEGQIARALLEAFVGAAGKARQREGERAIRDAVAARKRTA